MIDKDKIIEALREMRDSLSSKFSNQMDVLNAKYEQAQEDISNFKYMIESGYYDVKDGEE